MNHFLEIEKIEVLKHINKLLLTLAALAVLAACTTQKSRRDQSALSQLYHNTTAEYNGYFNANELLMAGQELLDNSYQDNYTKLLPMYKYIESENAQAIAPDMDEAIKKVSIVVNLHRYSKWTDDCYLLLGKAQFLKQDYESAEESLRYLTNEYSPEKMKKMEGVSRKDKKVSKKKSSAKKRKKKAKKKKKRGKKSKADKARERALKDYNKAVRKAKKEGAKAPPKPEILTRAGSAKAEAEAEQQKAAAEAAAEEKKEKDQPDDNDDGGFLKHRLAYQEGVLWLAKTLIERDNYDGALFFMSQLERDDKAFSDIRAGLAAVRAHYHLRQKDYAQALPALEQAIDVTKDRQQRARYAYIMAQIYQMQDNGPAAYAAFEQSMDFKPGYEMEFNCKLNMAQNAWVSGKGSAQDALANLERMLKDEKNAEFQDQIYFAMAQIALKRDDRPEAIRNLQLSLKYNQANRAQKAESYLALARLFYDEEQYVPSKNYYDSTLQVLAENDSRYDEVSRRSKSLKDIAENITIIELQDSLLRLSKLSDAEKELLALKIKKEQDEKRRQAIAEKAAAGSKPGLAGRRSIAPAAAGGALQKESSFFAYDDRAVKRGQREFEREWGNRPLEDNWRRSNKREASVLDLEADQATDAPDILTEDEVLTYLGDIPDEEGEIAAARIKIQEAMFKLGSLYRERLENFKKAAEVLEELNARFPENPFELDSWYQLYLVYTETGNQQRAQYYADKILEKYPTSTFAMLIKDPNYAEELAREDRRLTNYYDQAYAAFTVGNYQEAYQKSVSAREQFGPTNPLQPKFALLAAMSTGNLQGKDAYVNALKEVVAKFPNTDEQRRAREILRLLGESSASLPGNAREETTQFKLEDDALHYIIIVFKEQGINLNENKIIVSDYNDKYYKLDRIRISNIYLGESAEDRLPILVLRRFKDKKDAMKYYDGIRLNSNDFIPESVGHEIFPVTQNNYREILREKSVDNYRVFFQGNYLK